MKILLATGGTAGHIFPALALAHELRQKGHDVFFAGVFKTTIKRIQGAGYAYRELSARGVHTDTLASMLAASFPMLKALVEAIMLLRQERPDRVIGFGGYGAFAVVLAAVLLRLPTIIHEQNVLPGRANRLLSRWVMKIAISFEKTRKYFPAHKTVWTGYPCLRKGAGLSKDGVLREWGLDGDKKTILVLGGSQGSHVINEIFMETAALLKETLDFQVIHSSGQRDYDYLKEKYAHARIRYYLSPFLEQMEKAYCAADVVISRAGAGTVTEIAAFQLPCILIPYPHARQHQKENASVLTEAGNALVIDEQDLCPPKMHDAIHVFLKEFTMDKGVKTCLQQLCVVDATQRLAQEVLSLAAFS